MTEIANEGDILVFGRDKFLHLWPHARACSHFPVMLVSANGHRSDTHNFGKSCQFCLRSFLSSKFDDIRWKCLNYKFHVGHTIKIDYFRSIYWSQIDCIEFITEVKIRFNRCKSPLLSYFIHLYNVRYESAFTKRCSNRINQKSKIIQTDRFPLLEKWITLTMRILSFLIVVWALCGGWNEGLLCRLYISFDWFKNLNTKTAQYGKIESRSVIFCQNGAIWRKSDRLAWSEMADYDLKASFSNELGYTA